jgi:hypothetical protein
MLLDEEGERDEYLDESDFAEDQSDSPDDDASRSPSPPPEGSEGPSSPSARPPVSPSSVWSLEPALAVDVAHWSTLAGMAAFHVCFGFFMGVFHVHFGVLLQCFMSILGP